MQCSVAKSCGLRRGACWGWCREWRRLTLAGWLSPTDRAGTSMDDQGEDGEGSSVEALGAAVSGSQLAEVNCAEVERDPTGETTEDADAAGASGASARSGAVGAEALVGAVQEMLAAVGMPLDLDRSKLLQGSLDMQREVAALKVTPPA